MKMMRCIAIDDEKLALDLLEDNISKLPYLELVARCRNPLEALKVLENQEVDLIFLDIQMPGMSGLQFLKTLTRKPLVILITAYEQYALEAFGFDVVDYLVKPVPLDRFIKACNKAQELFQLRIRPASPGSEPEFMFLNADYSLVKVVFADILWIEGLRDYLKIHLKAPAKPLVARMNMGKMEETLPSSQFIRIHKSYIVSIRQITAVRKNSLFLGELELPVSLHYKEAVERLTGHH